MNKMRVFKPISMDEYACIDENAFTVELKRNKTQLIYHKVSDTLRIRDRQTSLGPSMKHFHNTSPLSEIVTSSVRGHFYDLKILSGRTFEVFNSIAGVKIRFASF